ncbi:phenoxybenzoate dioxygenase, partial [Escherichia coli]|nr:phenoxybenzoate dioxygenase [Escherichia coli]
TENGIIVDTACTTSDPAIFAAGDVAITRQADGSLVRVESWENANFQAQVAAAAMLNQPQPAATPGWFWTDQYRDNLQFIGEMQGDSWLIRGNSDAQRAIWFNLQDDVIVGAVTLNQGREIRLLRKWIQAKKKPPVAALIDETILLKSI